MKRHREKRYTLNDYIPMAQVVFRHNRDQAGVRSALRRLRDSFLADMYIDDIERSDIALYANELVRLGLSDGRILHVLSKLNKVLRHADDMGLLPQGRPKYQHTRHSRRREYEVTPEEEVELLRGLRRYGREFEQFAQFLLYTGGRYSEVTHLKWADWQDEAVTFKITKSGKPRTLPLYRPAREALIEAREQRPHHAGPFALFKKHRIFLEPWHEVADSMGIDDDDFTPHCLRHTCITRLVRSGMPLMKVKEWGGWSSLVMVQRYSHLEAARDLRTATKDYAIDSERLIA